MQSVMISIQPKWCELIASGKKTVEVRKTRPQIKTPFKCYIYCTKSRVPYESFAVIGKPYECGGKVIGEFICDEISSHYTQFGVCLIDYQTTSGLTAQEICEYGNGKQVYFWKISDLVIYDEPKELSEFFVYCGENPKCEGCEAHYYSNTESGKEDYCCSVIDGHRPLKRPPQSWCYVVEKEGAE